MGRRDEFKVCLRGTAQRHGSPGIVRMTSGTGLKAWTHLSMWVVSPLVGRWFGTKHGSSGCRDSYDLSQTQRGSSLYAQLNGANCLSFDGHGTPPPNHCREQHVVPALRLPSSRKQ